MLIGEGHFNHADHIKGCITQILICFERTLDTNRYILVINFWHKSNQKGWMLNQCMDPDHCWQSLRFIHSSTARNILLSTWKTQNNGANLTAVTVLSTVKPELSGFRSCWLVARQGKCVVLRWSTSECRKQIIDTINEQHYQRSKRWNC